MEEIFKKIENNFPKLIKFAEECESEILAKGRVLTATELRIANLLEIESAKKIRILKVDNIPRPKDPVLDELCDALGFIRNEGDNITKGITFGYGIYTRNCNLLPELNIMHELVHVSQYEKLKRINGFLKQYFQEIKEYYNIYKNLDEAKKKIPLEKEAYKFVMNYKTHKNGGLSSLLNKDNILC